MNERIKKLEEQAFDDVWNLDNASIGPGTHFRPDGFEKRFAELIVKECADLVDAMDHSSQYFPHVADAIKKHFGVEQ